jgi:hypothetical protein
VTETVVTDLRDHWVCPACGTGLCVRAGDAPEVPVHDRCGAAYELDETNVDCFAENMFAEGNDDPL